MRVAEPTVERLVLYYRLLMQLHNEERRVVSSQEIGEMLGLKASQVRKDLSYFGEIGKRGVGYHVERLYRHVSDILSPDRVWKIALVGVGRLGEALLGHKALRSEKFRLEALFDNDPAKIGQVICSVPCYDSEEMTEIIREKGIEVVILTVPAAAAQVSADRAVAAGTVKGILTFATTAISVSEEVLVYRVDISVELEKLLFFLKGRMA
ncbi:MAG TPA: redox-sensing transcriptional repressor Rex [Synergistales bacterium]|nr:redox-sensing transcriptional repressor Rex [Synergistales bacterium]HPK42424.1 redox-sensing transcriptional repressor Rex [Synergistales bacterium]